MLFVSACTTQRRHYFASETPAMPAMQGPSAPLPYQLPPRYHQPQTKKPSLWQAGTRTFLQDQRSHQVGDSVLVKVNITKDKAELKNNTDINPQYRMKQSLGVMAGLEQRLLDLLPKGADPKTLFDLYKKQTHSGEGSLNREETLTLKISCTLIKQLPQGHFVIFGQQQMTVGQEKRTILLAGITNPQDIQEDNTLSYQDIAEARLSYGGEGLLSDTQERRMIDKWLSAFFPF